MPGALVQIIATGIQDQLLIANPLLTFWKSEYRTYSNFALESMEQIFTGQADFGRRVSAVISRTGDLMWQVHLQICLPEIRQAADGTTVYARWLDYPGEQILAEAEIEVGGNRIDRYYGDWAHIWNQLTMPAAKQKSYLQMIGHTTQLTYLTDPNFANINGPCEASAGPAQVCAPRNALPETVLYIPLLFWFCVNPGLALPLIALQFHEVKINISFRPIGECLFAIKSMSQSSGDTKYGPAYTNSLVAASLYIDYVYLDVDERRFFVSNPHNYLITQVQMPGDESVGSASTRSKVNFNHPVKAMYFVVQPDVYVDYCSAWIAGTLLFNVLGAQLFNYTDAIDSLPNSVLAYGGMRSVAGNNGFLSASGQFQTAGAPDATSDYGFNNLSASYASSSIYYPFASPSAPTGYTAPYVTDEGSLLSDAGTFVLAETALEMHCWGLNPVITAKLQINGQDRFQEREGPYFDVVQPFQFHTRAPDTGINLYSFSLAPESMQPAGACNFSRIDNAYLALVLSQAAIGNSATSKIRIYGVSYNSFRVIGGMGVLPHGSSL